MPRPQLDGADAGQQERQQLGVLLGVRHRGQRHLAGGQGGLGGGQVPCHPGEDRPDGRDGRQQGRLLTGWLALRRGLGQADLLLAGREVEPAERLRCAHHGRPGPRHGIGQIGEDPRQVGAAPSGEQSADRQLPHHRRAHQLPVPRSRRVAHRLHDQSGSVEPRRCPQVQLGDQFRVLPPELVLEDLHQQRVVAVPPGRLVDGGGQDVVRLQPPEDRLAVGPPGQGLRERWAQPVDDAGPPQEVADVGCLDVEHLVDEVGGQGGIGRGKTAEEGLG
ncbi:hypothetical protein [Blastococcus sp. TF02A-30]|uniref:hypothetical protein n=1 Tax=Blastococcus sp. TF02A-30 TaxID=2250580 RepID=UPI000DE90151|nr:hypothetical protein [Blastococcus sp. TF02A-30]RBY89498.1 hypothetical protein DQ241_08605 [Blastococcus sp. TF02A-30]